MTHTHSPRASATSAAPDGSRRAFLLLRTLFTVAPIAFGLDKFLGILTDWERYLAPWVDRLVPGDAGQAILAVGVVEIVAGILVAVRPAIGGYVVAAWLLGIVVNLVSQGGYYDIALRDLGLMVGALALASLASSPASTAGARPATTEDAR